MGCRIAELAEGQKVSGIYLVRAKSLATTRAGKPFLTVKLGDRSGEIDAKVWEKADRVAQEFSKGDFLQVAGQVTEYNGKLQMSLQSLVRVEDATIDPADFLPSSARDPEEMWTALTAARETVADPDYRKLLQSIFEDPSLADKMRRAPAAKAMHHAYLGGLLEHTLSLFGLGERVAPHYPELDRDLLRTGILLHDLGKVEELTYLRGFDYSDRGRLLGHISIELEWISEVIRSLPSFPEEKALLLKHLLLSHHGREEFGSPVKPMTLEALVLHMLDDLDAKVQVFRQLMADPSPERWSKYHSLLGQYVFKGFDRKRESEKSPPLSLEKPVEEEKARAEDPPTLF
ncbi:MAG: HD domain-containing protein [Deltaproteobacteria bacterium]|nr:HD domain-containing protein [Deltaproteobacteria bacterium]